MKSAPFKDLRAAYQLHYYLCLRTKRSQPLFTPPIRASLEEHLTAICAHCQFHVLESQPYENHLRLLLSLRPEHSVAEAVKKIRGNLSRELCAQHSMLIEYWQRVANKKGFQIAQIRVLPDHCHLRVRLLPAMSALECALLLMNNSWVMMNRRFWSVLEQTGAWGVWEPSFYAATIGDVTTAEVKAYLQSAG
jgi:REP element-mobilizing transposase RayT